MFTYSVWDIIDVVVWGTILLVLVMVVLAGLWASFKKWVKSKFSKE